MAQLPEQYDPNEHEPQGDFEAIPPGIYTVEVTDSWIMETKAGDPAVKYEFTILGPEFAGRKLWNTFNMYHSTSEQARKIAEGQHSAMCRALGWLQPVDDTEVLHGRTCDVKVKVRTYTWDGEERVDNEIKAFKPSGGNSSAPSGGSNPPASSGQADGDKPWNRPKGDTPPKPPAAEQEAAHPAQAPQAPQEAAEESGGGEGQGEGSGGGSKPAWLK